jgi:hypothetical protein
MAEGSLEDGVNPPEQVVDAGLLLHGTTVCEEHTQRLKFIGSVS